MLASSAATAATAATATSATSSTSTSTTSSSTATTTATTTTAATATTTATTTTSSTTSASTSAWSGYLDASALPRCDLSDFLESFVNTKIQEKQTEIASRQNMQSENIARPDDLVIRVVSNDVCNDVIHNNYYY